MTVILNKRNRGNGKLMTKVSVKLGEQELSIETGQLAKQAHGAVLVKCGDTVVLTAVVGAKKVKDGQDFFPLTVDYREKTYAAGKIPGGFFKREGRPTEREILTCRLIDRPLRPLFPDGYLNEVSVSATVLSADGETNPDLLALIGASSALMISELPFTDPVGAVRVGLIDGKLVVNPTFSDLEKSCLDLVVAATKDNVVMIEGGGEEISEDKMIEAIEFGKKAVQSIAKLQSDLVSQCGKTKLSITKKEHSEEIQKKVTKHVEGRLGPIMLLKSKEERAEKREELYQETLRLFDPESKDYDEKAVHDIFNHVEHQFVRSMIVNDEKRPDGRDFTSFRAISCEVGVLPRTHGSALFTRGETQSLCVSTLGTSRDEQRVDALEGESFKRFMLHYNFPSYSVGESKPNRGPGRREIGHGALAERALKAVIPNDEAFPYAIRLVSEILESNGSSSMATVCGGTLALMDAGVPISQPVSGIAMGLVKEGKKWKVLTDIAGLEDHLGDMDFKVAGTRNGITAIQMDIKIAGVDTEILKTAFRDARDARIKILDIMMKTISESRQNLSEYAPRITLIKINPSKIGELIGPGGKNIRKIIEETGAAIDIADDGKVTISSTDANASKMAIERIEGMSQMPEVGKIYQGRVRKIMNFGAFCEILPGTDGLVHISELADGYVKKVEECVSVGDEFPVKVIGIDQKGKINLSRKQAGSKTTVQ
jgi:polyribonucleotide nucleotidyltransferase